MCVCVCVQQYKVVLEPVSNSYRPSLCGLHCIFSASLLVLKPTVNESLITELTCCQPLIRGVTTHTVVQTLCHVRTFIFVPYESVFKNKDRLRDNIRQYLTTHAFNVTEELRG